MYRRQPLGQRRLRVVIPSGHDTPTQWTDQCSHRRRRIRLISRGSLMASDGVCGCRGRSVHLQSRIGAGAWTDVPKGARTLAEAGTVLLHPRYSTESIRVSARLERRRRMRSGDERRSRSERQTQAQSTQDHGPAQGELLDLRSIGKVGVREVMPGRYVSSLPRRSSASSSSPRRSRSRRRQMGRSGPG